MKISFICVVLMCVALLHGIDAEKQRKEEAKSQSKRRGARSPQLDAHIEKAATFFEEVGDAANEEEGATGGQAEGDSEKEEIEDDAVEEPEVTGVVEEAEEPEVTGVVEEAEEPEVTGVVEEAEEPTGREEEGGTGAQEEEVAGEAAEADERR